MLLTSKLNYSRVHPSQPHLCYCLHAYESLAIIFYSEHVETKDITVRLLKIIKHTFGNTTYSKVKYFTSPCNINNFDGIKNGGA